MTRKVWVLAIAGIVGVSIATATLRASACDEKNKTASATPSCCAKEGAKTASVDAKKVHSSMVKSAVVAPGAAPILNVAAFGAMLAGGNQVGDCEWCPGMSMAAADCGAKMSASECSAKMGTQQAGAAHCPYKAMASKQSGIVTADVKGEGAATTVASNEHACGSATMAMAGGEGCGAHAAKTAAHGEEACCAATKTASLKGLVDEMPYKENKKVTLAGAYACGHCTLAKTEDCSPMFKTADGKVYPLFKNARSSAMKDMEGKNIQVSGSVKKVDGVKYLEVKSYKVL
jgi:hypothetical protein